MKFCLIISCNPNSSLSYTALKFAESIIKLNYQISTIFFLSDGVYHSLKSNNKEDNFWHDWLKLMTSNNIKLLTCSSANIKRGINIDNHKSDIKIAGLGELIIAMQESQRVIKF
tara:strand:- start:798 stop:1139 length:342 start_codon:yes stop_codon:yes gene_type:complete